MATPDAIEPIRGYRTWRTAPSGRLMAAGFDNLAWSREMDALCGRRSPHRAPEKNCMCGLYACTTLKALIRERNICTSSLRNQVIGEVDLWGKIIKHEWGYRAEHARVIGIYPTSLRARFIARRSRVRVLPRISVPPPCGTCFTCHRGRPDILLTRAFAFFTGMLIAGAASLLIGMVVTIVGG